MKTTIKSVEVNGKTWTKESLRELLATNDAAVVKGMLRIYEYQTETEQNIQATVEHNDVGFSGCDGQILASFAEQYKVRGSLTEKQMVIARKKMKKYAGQLLLIMAGALKPVEPSFIRRGR
jgi:hypothetical protein